MNSAPTTTAFSLQAEGLEKTYVIGSQEIPVLCGAGLSVSPGESLAVVGASGAGKSTLLHILGGLDRPDRGSVIIDGRPFYELSEKNRSALRNQRIGFVFQSYNLFPELDVLENVMLPAMARPGFGRLQERIRGRARELLSAVGLAERTQHTPLELSGGEQQRVALARALINEPELILADEPTGNLDRETGTHVMDSLFGLRDDAGRALVLVTHDEALAARCDRALRLKDGTLESL